MCQDLPPASAADAVGSASAALGWLATTAEQADALRALERVEAQLTAARSAVLAAFTASRGFEADAAASPVSWLRWQTRVTGAAAAAAAGWMRDLAGHPALAAALAAGDLSVSWARQVAGWTGRLPAGARPAADQILLDAAAGGARLTDLAGLAEQLHQATAGPDGDDGLDGFTSRRVRLLTHFRGAGTLDGELTPDCAAGLRAVLDALSAKAGPEDTRTLAQRQHDALAEACRRFIAGGLPDRAGQPTLLHLHMTLDQLLGQPGSGQATAAWAGYGAAAPPGADCDAALFPIVTGHLDPAELDRQARDLLTTPGPATGDGQPASPDPRSDSGGSGGSQPGTGSGPSESQPAGGSDSEPGKAGGGPGGCPVCGNPDPGSDSGGSQSGCAPGGGSAPDTGSEAGGCPVCGDPGHQPAAGPCHLRPETAAMAHTAARELLLTRATRLLSGPAGLAAHLRGTLLPQPAASISLPLDLGKPTDTIPASLRRAIITRDKHCAFPGCYQPPSACQVHHLVPRSRGGPTSLNGCCLLCTFHHLIAVHRWGWQLRLNPDGTTTATLGNRTLHSHPPAAA
jgi:hypothetical protein